ncbi:MAG: mechanosensitive ion channel family protein [Proteobacteria bacterium]|nr:mechanosensitive ion channel family protein [Pseudomonadota bacterium]
MEKTLSFIQSSTALSTLSILALTVIAAVLIDLITTRVLMHLAKKTKTNLDDKIVAALRRPLFLSVVLIGTGLAIRRLDLSEPTSQLMRNLLVTLAILLWTRPGMRIAKSFLEIVATRAEEWRYIHPKTLPLFEITIKTVIVAGAAYGLLLAWHVDVTAWLASAGILGIAVGFAAKDTLANLFSGIFILADAPYQISDFIVLDSGERGQVTDIGVRSTRILTRDDIEIIVPNAAIANAKIINESGGPHVKHRVKINVGVAYGSDIDKVREVLMDIANNSKFLVAHPEPRVRFRELGNSSLNFQLLGWIEEPFLRGKAIDELHTNVYKRFAAEKITIPFPQQDVHIRQQ